MISASLVIGLALGLITSFLYFMRRNMNYWKRRGVIYEKPHYMYGNLVGFLVEKNFHDTFNGFYKRMKGQAPFAGFFFLKKPAAFILDIELIKHILIKDFSNFINRGVFHNERDDPLSAHLFAIEGTKWKELRAKLSPTFTSGKIKFMYPTIVKVAERLVTVMNDLIESNDTLEMKELCSRYTTDVIGTCAFGIECNSLRDPNTEFRVMGRRAFTHIRHGNLIFGLMQSYPNLARKLGFCIVDLMVHKFFMRIVQETVAMREKENIKRNDFLDLLIDLKNRKSVELEDGTKLTGLTMNELAAQAYVFYVAGFETSSATLSFALYELALNQYIQNRLRRELYDTLAKHNHELSYECIKELQYHDQVISETLRLYTIVPHLDRIALNDYKVPGHPNLVIEKGTSIMIPAAAIHRDPKFYPDPEAFNPDRFSSEMMANRDTVQWLPFGDGPRNCIGMRFGQMQLRIGLAVLIKNYKFSVCEQTRIPMKFNPASFVLTSKDGIQLRVQKI